MIAEGLKAIIPMIEQIESENLSYNRVIIGNKIRALLPNLPPTPEAPHE